MDDILYQYTMTYLKPACRCGGRMVHHERTEKAWLFRCWVCRQEIERSKIVELDKEIFDAIEVTKDA